MPHSPQRKRSARETPAVQRDLAKDNLQVNEAVNKIAKISAHIPGSEWESSAWDAQECWQPRSQAESPTLSEGSSTGSAELNRSGQDSRLSIVHYINMISSYYFCIYTWLTFVSGSPSPQRTATRTESTCASSISTLMNLSQIIRSKFFAAPYRISFPLTTSTHSYSIAISIVIFCFCLFVCCPPGPPILCCLSPFFASSREGTAPRTPQ